jgi:hypothetical protein
MTKPTTKATRASARPAEPAANEETAAAAQQPQVNDASAALQALPCVAVWFDYVRADATRGTDRVYIQGVYDIRFRVQLEEYERMIVEQSNGQILKAMITNWKSLEG